MSRLAVRRAGREDDRDGSGESDPLPDDAVSNPEGDSDDERGNESSGSTGDGARGVMEPETVLLEIDGETVRGSAPFCACARVKTSCECVRLLGGVAGKGNPSTEVSCTEEPCLE